MPQKRKVSEIWKKVDGQRAADIKPVAWKQSYDGIKAALECLELQLVTTREEFSALPIPLNPTSGKYAFMKRQVVVSRNDKTSGPVRIQELLKGSNALLTDAERQAIEDNKRVVMQQARPKGQPTTTLLETQAIDALNTYISSEKVLQVVHLVEFRLADAAYRCWNNASEDFVGDQVKSSVC